MKVDYNHVFTARLRDYPVWFLFLSPWAVEAVLYNSAIHILSHNFDLVFVCLFLSSPFFISQFCRWIRVYIKLLIESTFRTIFLDNFFRVF